MYDKIRQILTGKESTKLYREFLKRNNQTDILILKATKVRLSLSTVIHPSNFPRIL